MKKAYLTTLALLVLAAGCGGGKEKDPQAASDQINALTEGQIADALEDGCAASTTDLVAFMKAFLPKVGIDPSLATNPDVQEAVDNLEGIDPSNLPESCGASEANPVPEADPIDEPEADRSEDQDSPLDTTPPDVTPPDVVRVSPEIPYDWGRFNVADSLITVRFSEPVDVDSILENESIEVHAAELFSYKISGKLEKVRNMGGAYEYYGDKALEIRFIPDHPLLTTRNSDGTRYPFKYQVKVFGNDGASNPTRAVKDLAGNPLAETYTQTLTCGGGDGMIPCRIINR